MGNLLPTWSAGDFGERAINLRYVDTTDRTEFTGRP